MVALSPLRANWIAVPSSPCCFPRRRPSPRCFLGASSTHSCEAACIAAALPAAAYRFSLE
jgi:hypothetical protein